MCDCVRCQTAYHDRGAKPTCQARCNCGELTEWYWYEDEPDPDDDEPSADPWGEWQEALCWRCSAICCMKAEMSLARMGLGLGGELLPKYVDRFIEIMVDDSVLLDPLPEAVEMPALPWPRD